MAVRSCASLCIFHTHVCAHIESVYTKIKHIVHPRAFYEDSYQKGSRDEAS